jgi:hypothetical protein
VSGRISGPREKRIIKLKKQRKNLLMKTISLKVTDSFWIFQVPIFKVSEFQI